MPWIHFHTGDDGIAKACCVANIPYGNINTESFDSIWNGKNIEQLRQKFAKGEKDKRCAHCFKLEAPGGKSIRQETFEKFGHLNVLSKPLSLPVYFDIRFSNVCNFKCRTCWHGASSAWFEDAKALGSNKSAQAVIKNITDFKVFIEKIGSALVNAKEIYLAGGEPLATEEHYQLLQWLIDHNATQMKLRYNTNFSILKFKNHDVLAYWKQFKHVEIMASIDATEKLGEYIRSGMKWKKVIENHKKIHALAHIDFKIAPTVSVLNVAHIPNLYKASIQLGLIGINDMYINILERPFYYNIQIIPEQNKKEIVEKYQSFFTWLAQTHPDSTIKRQFEDIIHYMCAADHSSKWPLFIAKNGALDLLRGESNPLL